MRLAREGAIHVVLTVKYGYDYQVSLMALLCLSATVWFFMSLNTSHTVRGCVEQFRQLPGHGLN